MNQIESIVKIPASAVVLLFTWLLVEDHASLGLKSWLQILMFNLLQNRLFSHELRIDLDH
jgi:hypothetical protein